VAVSACGSVQQPSAMRECYIFGAANKEGGVMRKKPPRRRPGPAFHACESCTNGWTAELRLERGRLESRMVRCRCWRIHQEKITALEAVGSQRKQRLKQGSMQESREISSRRDGLRNSRTDARNDSREGWKQEAIEAKHPLKQRQQIIKPENEGTSHKLKQ
jgi:hypothetical protein